MCELRFKLKPFLEANSITVYALGVELARMGAATTGKTVYSIVTKVNNPRRQTISDIWCALERLAGRTIALDELLEVVRD